MTKFENQLEKAPKISKAIIVALVEILGTLIVWVGSMALIASIFKVYLPNPHNPNVADEIRFAFFLLLLSFILPGIFLFAMRKFLLGKPIISLFNASGNFRFSSFAAGFVISVLILVSTMLAAEPRALELAQMRMNAFGFGSYLLIMSVYLISFFVQTAFEEVFFRATIVQHLSRTGLPIFISLLVSALIFSLFHYAPKIGIEVLFGVFIMGASYNYATYRTQGIEIAMGAHFANNLIVGAILGSFDNTKNFENALIAGLIYSIAFVALLETFLHFSKKATAKSIS